MESFNYSGSDDDENESIDLPEPKKIESDPLVNQFKVDALSILDTSEDYQTGVNTLIDTYKNTNFTDKEAAKEALSQFSNDLRFKARQKPPSVEETIAIAPVKMEDIEGETPIERANKWQKANVDAVNASDDADYVALRTALVDNINSIASEVRREQNTSEEGFIAGTSDKLFRFAEGAAAPLNSELGRYFHERTSPKRESGLEGLSGKVMGAFGFMAPALAAGAVTGGGGLAVALGAQAGAVTLESYGESLRTTGDEERALISGLLTGASQAVSFAPLGSAATKFVGAFGKKFVPEVAGAGVKGTLVEAMIDAIQAQKVGLGGVALRTLGAATAGTAGQVIGNIAANIGLDENGDVTHGASDAFLTNAIVAGVFDGGHALMTNLHFNQAKKAIALNKEPPVANEADPKAAREVADTSAPRYSVNEDGDLVQDPPRPRTVDQDIADRAYYDKAVEDYQNEPYSEGDPKVLYDEAGEPVGMPVQEDVEVNSIPSGRIVFTDLDAEHSPSVAVTNFAANALGATYELRRNISDGAFGSYNPGTGVTSILRSLGANAIRLKQTMAHEIGHFLDDILNSPFGTKAFKDVAERLSGVKSIMQKAVGIDADTLNEQAKQISMMWRKGWDGSPGRQGGSSQEAFNHYRNRPEEIYADTFSALANNPELVRTSAPELYDAFEKGLARHPELNKFWTDFQRMSNDPDAIANFNMQIRGESRAKTATINAAVRLSKIKTNSRGARLQRSLSQAFDFVFNRYTEAAQKVSKLDGEAREVGMSNLLNIKRKDYTYHWIERNMHDPMQKVFLKFLQADIPINTWAHYEWANHLLNDTTTTMARVNDNFDLYRKAGRMVRDMLLKNPKTNKNFILETLSDEAFSAPDKLNDALAQLPLIGDVAQVLQLEDFVQRLKAENPNNPNIGADALRQYKLAVANLNRRKTSVPIEELRSEVSKLPKGPVRDALEDITRDGAFNARKYLVNSDGATVYDASRDLASIRRQLTPKQFSTLKGVSDEFHGIMSKVLPFVKESGMLTPDLLSRIELNKGHYVTTQVLKYFEGDDKITASIRKAQGTLSEVGDELSATYLKQQALLVRAKDQIARNAAIRVADGAGDVLAVTKQKFGQNIFDERARLERLDKENTYVIGYNKGTPSIYKLRGERYGRMFKSIDGKDVPVLSTFLQISDAFNTAVLTKAFKTVLSPAFIYSQKLYDRKIEAVYLNSFAPRLPFAPVHLFGKARTIDKSTISELKHFRETGELTGGLKRVVDLDGALLEIHSLADQDLPTEFSFPEAVYDAYGQPLPKEGDVLDKIGVKTQAAIDKLGGKRLKELAEFDELRAKVNGFKIGKEMGMGDAEAAIFAQERFGIPDPLAGGTGATMLNRMFLFGRAHFNGLRAVGSLVKDMPQTAATQIAYRVVLPKLLLTPLAVAAMKGVFGDERSEVYEAGLQMIPKFDKIATNPILFGFQDGRGNFHNLFDVKKSDIQADWKAWYSREPQSRQLTSVTRILWPIVENLGKGDIGGLLSETASGAQGEAFGSVQPAFQYMWNIFELIKGQNPTDFYRMKGILDNNTAAGGSAVDKLSGYSRYVLAQQYPSVTAYNPFATDTTKGVGETLIRQVPLAGPMARRFVGVSNYGLIEANKAAETTKKVFDAQIANSTGDSTQELLNEFRTASGRVNSLGKGWQEKVGPEVALKTRALTTWHTRIWQPYRNELRAAKESKDFERYDHIVSALEGSARAFLQAYGKIGEKEDSDS